MHLPNSWFDESFSTETQISWVFYVRKSRSNFNILFLLPSTDTTLAGESTTFLLLGVAKCPCSLHDLLILRERWYSFCQGWEFYLPTRPPLTPGEWGCPYSHRRGADSPHSPQNCFNTILVGKGSSAWWVWKSRLPPLVPIDTTQWGLITAWQGSKPISVFSLV